MTNRVTETTVAVSHGQGSLEVHADRSLAVPQLGWFQFSATSRRMYSFQDLNWDACNTSGSRLPRFFLAFSCNRALDRWTPAKSPLASHILLPYMPQHVTDNRNHQEIVSP